VVELAVTEANRLGHNYIGTEHLLMGILREYDSVAAKLIVSTGVDLNKMYTEIINIFGSSDYRPRQAAPVGKSEEIGYEDARPVLPRPDRHGAQRLARPVIGREKEIQRVIQILSRGRRTIRCLSASQASARRPSPRAWRSAS
jgi:ATP-dependent Clp protease ATP-binding subunit ClpC